MTRLKLQAKEIFSTVRYVECPAFHNEKIIFNAKGLSHLFYKGARKVQTRMKEQVHIRIKLLPFAIQLLKIMPVYQEEAVYTFKGKAYRFWAFEGVIEEWRIKVIVRQVGNGAKHFWSVIPSWKKVGRFVRNAKSDLTKQ